MVSMALSRTTAFETCYFTGFESFFGRQAWVFRAIFSDGFGI
jgi:hypothetical protein